MKKDGRYSAVELSVVPRHELSRPEPPTHLSEPGRRIFRSIVSAFRNDWFASCPEILSCYCATAVIERDLAQAIAQRGSEDPLYVEMVRLHCAVASSLSSLCTRLRITPRSRRDGRDARLVPLPGGKRPWEDVDSEPDPAA